MGAFSAERDEPQLVHIATDGESYGHHHRFGDMALAYALNCIESNRVSTPDELRRNFSNAVRRRMKSRSSKKPPGVVFTASTAGGATAAATPAAIQMESRVAHALARSGGRAARRAGEALRRTSQGAAQGSLGRAQ